MENQEETFISKKGQLIPFMPTEVVAYPGQIMNFHIKVPSYLQLMRVCEQNEKVFGILPIVEHQLFGYGCTVKILSIKRQNDGSAMVVWQGQKIFRLIEFFNENECDDETYPVGFIRYLPQEDEKEVSFAIYEKVLNVFCKIAQIFREKGGCDLLEDDIVVNSLAGMNEKNNERMTSYCMANKLLGLHLCEKAALLTLKSESKRLKTLYFQMKNLVSVLEKVFRD